MIVPKQFQYVFAEILTDSGGPFSMIPLDEPPSMSESEHDSFSDVAINICPHNIKRFIFVIAHPKNFLFFGSGIFEPAMTYYLPIPCMI